MVQARWPSARLAEQRLACDQLAGWRTIRVSDPRHGTCGQLARAEPCGYDGEQLWIAVDEDAVVRLLLQLVPSGEHGGKHRVRLRGERRHPRGEELPTDVEFDWAAEAIPPLRSRLLDQPAPLLGSRTWRVRDEEEIQTKPLQTFETWASH